MPGLEPVDLVLIDPPYPNNANYFEGGEDDAGIEITGDRNVITNNISRNNTGATNSIEVFNGADENIVTGNQVPDGIVNGGANNILANNNP